MSTSDTGVFRRRQAIADLNRQRLAFPLATVRRIGAGLNVRNTARPDLQQRLEWYFSGRAPVADLRRDGLVHGALLMASALPDDDFDQFIAATVLLLLERLSAERGRDDGFWNWRRLAPHYRLAAPSLRAAVMCGFREARRLDRIDLKDGPTGADCLTTNRIDVLVGLAAGKAARPLLAEIETAIAGEADARRAGALWVALHADIARLPDSPRRAAEDGFRYLYERPAAIDPPPGADVPAIPGRA
jgi:hypothetical protein